MDGPDSAGSRSDRRRFLGMAGAGALAVPLLGSMPARAAGRDVSESAVVINALGGLSNPNARSEEPAPATGVSGADRDMIDARVIADARASGLTAVNITLGHVAGDMEPFEHSVREIGIWDRRIERHSADLVKVRTAADIVKAKRENRIGVIYGFQNSTMMGDDVSRVDIFANLGVRVFQLTYNPANAAGDGSMAPENRGLTPFGRALVDRLNANDVMVDLSHSGQRTCLDAIRASRKPISINHTGCRALVDLPRNKTDEELRLVAEKGGFVGIYFMPFLNKASKATADDVVAHIEHALKVCGEDHVGIGTDGGITAIDDLDAYKAEIAIEIANRKAAGIGAVGENPDTLPFVIDLRGPDQFHDLADRLRARGHSERVVDKILGLNFLSYAKMIWGA